MTDKKSKGNCEGKDNSRFPAGMTDKKDKRKSTRKANAEAQEKQT
jgi:hypothetical protein